MYSEVPTKPCNRDTLGAATLSFINSETIAWFGAMKCVHYWEFVFCSEGPLSEVPIRVSVLGLVGSQ